MMGALICIFYILGSMNFNKFYSSSIWRESFREYEKERQGYEKEIFDIIPISPSFKYESFKSGSTSWSSYYYVSIPLVSFQHLYFPLVYGKYSRLIKAENKHINKLVKLKMVEDYVKLWCYIREINNIDTLIKIYEKTLIAYETSGEKELDILKTEKKIQDLAFIKSNLFNRFRDLLKKHGIEEASFDTLDEDLPDIIKLMHDVLNEWKDLRTSVIVKKLDYLNRKKVYSLLEIGPSLNYILAYQFLSLTPTERLRGNTIKGSVIGIQLSPLQILHSINAYNSQIRELKYELRLKKIQESNNIAELNMVIPKIQFLNKLRGYYVEMEKLYEKGTIDFVTFSETADFYYSTYNDILEEIIQIIERSVIYETS